MKNKPDRLHLDKKAINKLPMHQYRGPTVVIKTPAKAEEIARKLRKESILGFDTETRPAFRKGERYDPALLQLGTRYKAFLFQLKRTGITDSMRDILSDPGIRKVGVAIKQDLKELRQIRDFEPHGFVELADQARKAGFKNLGLRGITAILFGFRISKGQQLSNWAREKLTKAQIRYAATDAWIGRKIYLKMKLNGLLDQENSQ